LTEIEKNLETLAEQEHKERVYGQGYAGDHRKTAEIDASPYVEMGETYLKFEDGTPFEVWSAVTQQLVRAERSIRWWIGDAIRFGEHKYGEKYAQAIEATGYSYGTLANSVYVAGKYDDFSLRNENCTFRQHEITAPLEPVERAEVLETALVKGWTEKQLREEVRERRTLPANPTQGSVEVLTPPVDTNLVTVEEAEDVEVEDPNAIKEIVRAGAMEFVVEFGDGSRHTVTRGVLLGEGWKKCPNCSGHGIHR